MPHLLIVEDDAALSLALQHGFESGGHHVRVVDRGAGALAAVEEEQPDLIVLDVMLPDLDGVEVCRRLNESGSRTPIILLTALDQERHKVRGLRAGADDYVTKPFSFLELEARVEAVLRRSQKTDLARTFAFGELQVDRGAHTATRLGQPVGLTSREFALLCYFAQRPGVALSRVELLRAVWGMRSSPRTRTVDVHLSRLRRKVEVDPEQPRVLVTVHGSGYRYEPC